VSALVHTAQAVRTAVGKDVGNVTGILTDAEVRSALEKLSALDPLHVAYYRHLVVGSAGTEREGRETGRGGANK
jgi:hypothetical protein